MNNKYYIIRNSEFPSDKTWLLFFFLFYSSVYIRSYFLVYYILIEAVNQHNITGNNFKCEFLIISLYFSWLENLWIPLDK